MLEGHLPPHLQQIVEASLRGIQELAAAGAAAPEDEGEEAEQAAAEAMEAAAAPAAALAEVAAAAVAGVSTPEASEVQHSSQVEAVLTGSDLDEQASLLFWQLALR